MTASPIAPKRRSRFALRFSLRLLLIAFTAFAIGFPIWYRWPYEELVEQTATPPYKKIRTTTTWQRQWGGGRLKHGVMRSVWDGITARIETYENDKQHGPFKSFYLNGPLSEEGQYVDDQKDGLWTHYHEDGVVKATFTWQRGVLEGPASISGKSGSHQLLFAGGRLVQVDDRPVEDRLGALAAGDNIDSPAIRDSLKSVTGIEYTNLPVHFIAENMSQINIFGPIIADGLNVDANLRVSFSGHNLDYASALAAMATLHDLQCDYRYGAVWITSPEDGKDWHDPTGVADIVPPKDSQLALSWNEPVTVLAKQQPLADVLNQLVAPLAIDVDVSRIATGNGAELAYPVDLSVQGHPFRHAVGILLYQTRCRCRLEGETLVILAPE